MKKSKHTKAGYYDWSYIDSYLNEFNLVMVIGARGCGKTYGLRKAAIQDYIKRKERFVEIVRYKSELNDFSFGYFDKFVQNKEFKEYQFKTEGKRAYIARATLDEDEKPEWELCGYFVSLSEFQRKKRVTFADVRRIIFDECVIDKRDSYHRYMRGEFSLLLEMASTIIRENPNEKNRARIFLLGNACDLTCPYFEELGINELNEYGMYFNRVNKSVVDYVEPWDADERRQNTIVGLLSSTHENKAMFANQFTKKENGLIMAKSKLARFEYAIIFRGYKFGIWLDMHEGLYFITAQIPKNQEQRTFAMTAADGTFNYRMIRKVDSIIKSLIGMLYLNAVRYESEIIQENFSSVLQFLGVKEK